MSKRNDKFFEQLKEGDPPSLAESVREAGSTLKNIGGQLWDALAPLADHGATEMMNGIFHGNAFTPYGWSHTSEGQEVEAPKAPEQQKEVVQDRGMEM